MSTSAGTDPPDDHGSRLLKALREIRGMTQRDLEDASEVSRSTVSRIETGKKSLERKDREDLARGLGISVDTFREVSAIIRKIDREAAGSLSRQRGVGPDRARSSVLEGAAEARSAVREERHRRIAEAAGRSTEETVFRMLQLADLDFHDEY